MKGRRFLIALLCLVGVVAFAADEKDKEKDRTEIRNMSQETLTRLYKAEPSAKAAIEKTGRKVPVIAKLEKPEAIDNLDEILEVTEGVMVARGDLGVEMNPERVPVVQKLVIAREFERQPKVLIAAQPTRGVDVGAIEFIHQRIVRARDEGAGVLLVSFELDDILTLSDRILVMYEGRIVAEFKRGEVSERELGLKMAGS